MKKFLCLSMGGKLSSLGKELKTREGFDPVKSVDGPPGLEPRDHKYSMVRCGKRT